MPRTRGADPPCGEGEQPGNQTENLAMACPSWVFQCQRKAPDVKRRARRVRTLFSAWL